MEQQSTTNNNIDKQVETPTKKRQLEDENQESQQHKQIKLDNINKNNNNQKKNKQKVEIDDDDILNTFTSDDKDKKPGYFGKFRKYKKHTALYATDKKVKGLFITCDQNKEGNSVGEILPILKSFALKYFPREESNDNSNNNDISTTTTTTTTTTTNSNNTDQGVKHFTIINSGCAGIYFISILHDLVNPTDFVGAIFVDIYQRKIKKLPEDSPYREKLKYIQDNLPESTKKMIKEANNDIIIQNKLMAKVKFTHKIIPIIGTSRTEGPDVTEMTKEAVKLLNQVKPKSFAIEYRSRNNSNIKREELVKEVASYVDPSIKVDLKQPEYTVIIEIIKTCATIGIVNLYNDLYKYNIRELCRFNPMNELTKQQIKKEIFEDPTNEPEERENYNVIVEKK